MTETASSFELELLTRRISIWQPVNVAATKRFWPKGGGHLMTPLPEFTKELAVAAMEEFYKFA